MLGVVCYGGVFKSKEHAAVEFWPGDSLESCEMHSLDLIRVFSGSDGSVWMTTLREKASLNPSLGTVCVFVGYGYTS